METHLTSNDDRSQKLTVTKKQIIMIRNLSDWHGPLPILSKQRKLLVELFGFSDSASHEVLEIQGMTNGFDRSDSTVYITHPALCQDNVGCRPGDILTYRNSFDGLEGMVLGCTSDFSKIAILNLNYEDPRYIIEHYEKRHLFGGFPNPQDVRELTETVDEWIEDIDIATEDGFSEEGPLSEKTVVVKKSDIIKIRNMEKKHGHIPISEAQRKALHKLFRMYDYESSYLKLEGLVDGFSSNGGNAPSQMYITIRKAVNAFGRHGLNPGDILEYSVNYTGLEGMILGVTQDRQKIAILNLNYGQERYLLEHYSANFTFGNYPSPGDKRSLARRFIDRGLRNPEVANYHEVHLLPFLRDLFGDYNEFLPDPVIRYIAEYVAEMTSIEDFGLLMEKKKSKSRMCIIS